MRAEKVAKLYRRRADGYDRSIRWYKRLLFFDVQRYRRVAVQRLDLVPGEAVLDIGCGTGLNFPHLEAAVGPRGRIIGLDLTPEMLAKAEERVRDAGWRNVELVRGDAAKETFHEVDAVLSTYAFSLMPDPRPVLQNAVLSLTTGGRMAVLDMQYSRHWQGFLANPIALLAALPYGASMDLRRWYMKHEMEAQLQAVSFEEYYLGICYVALGWKPDPVRPEVRRKEVASHGRPTTA